MCRLSCVSVLRLYNRRIEVDAPLEGVACEEETRR